MSLLVRVVDVVVLLRLFVLPRDVVDDAPDDVDAVGGDANGEGVVGRRCVALRCCWRWCWWVSWLSDGVGVVGVGAGRGLRLGGRRFRACHSWLVVGRLVVLVVPVVSGMGVLPSAVLGSVVVGVAPVVVEGVDAVGGWRCR